MRYVHGVYAHCYIMSITLDDYNLFNFLPKKPKANYELCLDGHGRLRGSGVTSDNFDEVLNWNRGASISTHISRVRHGTGGPGGGAYHSKTSVLNHFLEIDFFTEVYDPASFGICDNFVMYQANHAKVEVMLNVRDYPYNYYVEEFSRIH